MTKRQSVPRDVFSRAEIRTRSTYLLETSSLERSLLGDEPVALLDGIFSRHALLSRACNDNLSYAT